MTVRTLCVICSLVGTLIISDGARLYAAPIIAQSGFNDQSGINSNPTPNSPFKLGVTVNNQGAGESGWDGLWQRLGGFDDRAPVSQEFVYEGDGAVKLFTDNVFGTSIERPWFDIVPQVRVDTYVLVRPGAQMRGQIVYTAPPPTEIYTRNVAAWEIASNGNITVFNKATNSWDFTGFQTLPNQWNKYSLIANTENQTYQFLFNDQLYLSPTALGFINPSLFVDRINLQGIGLLNSYVDAVVVTVPETSSFVMIAVAGVMGGFGWRLRRFRTTG